MIGNRSSTWWWAGLQPLQGLRQVAAVVAVVVAAGGEEERCDVAVAGGGGEEVGGGGVGLVVLAAADDEQLGAVEPAVVVEPGRRILVAHVGLVVEEVAGGAVREGFVVAAEAPHGRPIRTCRWQRRCKLAKRPCAVNNVPAPSYPSQYASVFSVAATAGDVEYEAVFMFAPDPAP